MRAAWQAMVKESDETTQQIDTHTHTQAVAVGIIHISLSVVMNTTNKKTNHTRANFTHTNRQLPVTSHTANTQQRTDAVAVLTGQGEKCTHTTHNKNTHTRTPEKKCVRHFAASHRPVTATHDVHTQTWYKRPWNDACMNTHTQSRTHTHGTGKIGNPSAASTHTNTPPPTHSHTQQRKKESSERKPSTSRKNISRNAAATRCPP